MGTCCVYMHTADPKGNPHDSHVEHVIPTQPHKNQLHQFYWKEQKRKESNHLSELL